MFRMTRTLCRSFCLAKPGIAVLGRCNEEERQMIRSVWEQLRHNIDHATEATIWMNIIMNDKFLVKETPEVIKLHAWAVELLKKHRGEKYFLQKMSLFFTAKHSKHEQEFHLDYHEDAESFLIPMVPVSTLNSTMYMTSYSTATPTPGKYTLNRFGKDDFDLLDREGRDYAEIAQIVCREFTILHLQRNTVHRGIKNSSDYDRPMLDKYLPSCINW